MIRTHRTLDDLHDAIQEKGFKISRSGLYLRLLPRNARSIEGKRHVKMAPVKLSRAQIDEHKIHPDGVFCTSTIRNVESLASLLGTEEVIFLSQGDKAKVPIGMTAANKQSPMMMHLEYRVQLSDHDWAIAPKHKLTPSVYKTVSIKPGCMGSPEAVTYSSPTYVAIRSLKHSSSNAQTHSEDFNTLLNLELLKDFVRNSAGEVKPVLMISADGGPDENPRYPKVISFAIQHFKQHDLDALFIVTNAPGRSASFNRVERTMAPLSAQLAGLMLPAATFGSHLNEKGQAADDQLELKIFTAAGEVLAEVWKSLVIDGYEVFAEFKKPGKEPEVPQSPDPLSYSLHVQESQYALQIVKCRNPACCKPMRSSLFDILPGRFLPPPCPLRQTTGGLTIPAPAETSSKDRFMPLFQRIAIQCPILLPLEWKKMPYDMYCPTLSKNDLKARTCHSCGQYFASKKSVENHTRGVHSGRSTASQAKPSKIKPARVSSRRRGEEVLCVIRNDTFGTEECEWHDQEDVDLHDVPVMPCEQESAEIHPVEEYGYAVISS